MLILTRHPDHSLGIRLAEGVDPATPIGEVLAEGAVLVEENGKVAESSPTCSERSKPADPKLPVDDAEAAERSNPAAVQFSLPAAACQRIRNDESPRRVLGPHWRRKAEN